MYIVESGTLVKKWPEGAPVVVEKGGVVGWLHFFQKDPSSVEVVVGSDAELSTLSSDEFHDLLAQRPEFLSNYVTLLTRHLRKELNIIHTLHSIVAPKSDKLKVAFYDNKKYFQEAFEAAMEKLNLDFSISWFDTLLNESTATLAQGHQVVCCFVQDVVNAPVLAKLKDAGVGLVALRCAGYDKVDLVAAKQLDISVTRVPAYSPHAVAEHAIALMLALNRRLQKATHRTRDFNFSLEGLVGFNLHGKTVGVFGTGKIGRIAAEILLGFGCKVLAHDLYPNEELQKKGVVYVSKDELLRQSKILTIHAPLVKSTRHWLDAESISKMQKGALIVNTSRGPLIDTKALLHALRTGHIGGAAMDVVEGEEEYFFKDYSDEILGDSVIEGLINCPNVILTGHMAFLTEEALENIAVSTLSSIKEFADGKRGPELTNFVKAEYQ